MKMENPVPNNENTFLADWLEGKISDDQLRIQVSEADFEAYLKLRDTLGSYQVSEPDMDHHYQAIKTKMARALDAKEKPVRKIRPYVYMAVAASLLLFFGLYQFFAFSNSVQTTFGETTALHLADGSLVKINAKSKVDYPTLFKYNRELRLDGEAFFEVQKGSKFSVETALGTVEVLGTKFNVIAQDGFFEVVCFEGRVKVTHKNQSAILTPGKAIRFFENSQENWRQDLANQPERINGESTFRNTPLLQVIHQFENQYQYKVAFPESLANVRFTGSFTHKNKQTALQSICLPMQLKHAQTGNGTITISE
jgi:transmembrane sensor